MTAIKIGERYRTTLGNEGIAVDIAGQFAKLRFDDGDVSAMLYRGELSLVEPVTPSFSNGDVVKLTSPNGPDDFEVRGTVYDDWWIGKTPGKRVSVNVWLDAGASLEVVEHAPKPLPTEPGHYVGQNDMVYTLLEDGDWFLGNRQADPDGLELTRLVPEVSAS